MFSNRFLKSFDCCKYMYRKRLHANNRRTFAWGSFMDSPEKKIIHPNKYDLCGNNSGTKLDYMSSLNIDSETNSLRLSSIICTIGPASADVKVLETLMDAGMNIARLNLSHGTHEYHSNTVKNLREAAAKYGEKIGTWYPLAIALDTKGPEIRTGLLGGERDAPKEVELRKGEKIRLTTDVKFEKTGTDKQVFVDYANITRIVKEGNSVYLDDGLILLTVSGVGEKYVDCTIENGGMLGNQKGVNLPGLDVDLPAVSEKDKADLRFAVENDLDLIFASFVREASAVHEIRKILGECGESILIVPKIENHQGIKNLQSIIDVSNGIMVARGDLGIEIPPEKVFLAQKSIIARCNANGKPVICATQMLESMVKKPRATRAESTDVANAILDGADCVMLSGETAKGKYPVECVRTMDKLCREAESALWRKELFNDLMSAAEYTDCNQLIAMEAVIMANDVDVTAIIVTSSTDLKLAHAIAKYRPLNVILVVTNDRKTARQCHLHRGLLPVFYAPETGCNVDPDDRDEDTNSYLKYAMNFGKSRGILASGDTVIFVNDSNMGYLELSDVIHKCTVL